MSQEISKNIPNMLSESSLALSKAKKELKGLGVPPSQIRNVHIEFDRVISVRVPNVVVDTCIYFVRSSEMHITISAF